MRIPHHLSRSETGRWSFVQRVPVDLQAVLDCRLIKRTLRTKDLVQAHVRAVVLGAGYARLFAQLKDQRVAKLSKTDADLLIDRLTSAENLRELTLNRTRAMDGTVTEQWQIDSPKDLKLYRQLMELEAMAATLQQPEAAHRGPTRQIWPQVTRAPVAPPTQAIETITLGKARDAFLATLKPSTLPKTYTIKKTGSRHWWRSWGRRPRSTRSRARTWPAGIRTCGRRAILVVSAPTSARPVPALVDAHLRRARVCYDHMAGELAVRLANNWVLGGWIQERRGIWEITTEGQRGLERLGIPLPNSALRRPAVRSCLDWSERRSHLAGQLGAALLDVLLIKGIVRRCTQSRGLQVTVFGERELDRWIAAPMLPSDEEAPLP